MAARPPRLLHLNGPPGIGKSTLARRWVEERPGILNCDIDVLRMLVGGWRDDFVVTGEVIRPAALAMIGAHLDSGRDVVMPQMIARSSEVERFRAAATAAGATYLQVMLVADRDEAIARFHRRAGDDALTTHVREVVARDGGDPFLGRLFDGLAVLARRDGVVVVPSVEGDVDGTYARLGEAVGGRGSEPQRSGAPGHGTGAAPNDSARSDASVSSSTPRRRSSPSVEATSRE